MRWPLYPAELVVFAAALALTVIMQRRHLAGSADVSIVQVRIALKAAWAGVLCVLALRAGGDPPLSHLLATISQSLTFLMGLCLAILFAKRVRSGRHE